MPLHGTFNYVYKKPADGKHPSAGFVFAAAAEVSNNAEYR